MLRALFYYYTIYILYTTKKGIILYYYSYYILYYYFIPYIFYYYTICFLFYYHYFMNAAWGCWGFWWNSDFPVQLLGYIQKLVQNKSPKKIAKKIQLPPLLFS